MLFLSLALAAPTVVVIPHPDGVNYQLRVGADRTDAWTFSAHYDKDLHRAIRPHVYLRRLAFLGGLFGGLGAITGGLIWHATNQGQARFGPITTVTSGIALIVTTIPITAADRSAYLEPRRFWSLQEAQALASKRPITHGLVIVETSRGWGVINRSGRLLSATEVASRIGDRPVLKRARNKALGANLTSTLALLGGYALVIGGVDQLGDKRHQADRRWTGVGAAIAGTGLVVGGALGQSRGRSRTPAHFWDRDVLQQLLDAAE